MRDAVAPLLRIAHASIESLDADADVRWRILIGQAARDHSALAGAEQTARVLRVMAEMVEQTSRGSD